MEKAAKAWPLVGATTPTADEIRSVVAAIVCHDRHSATAINLVPSETKLSPLARLPLQSDFYNRYFFNDTHDPTFWQFRGAQAVGVVETDLAIPALRRLSGANHVNVRPISGLSAMLITLAALGGLPGSVVVSIAHDSGGHYATASVIERLGLLSRTVPMSRGTLHLDALREELRTADVTLVYLDMQNSLEPLDVPPVVAAVHETSPSTLVHVDSSHTLGLVLGGVMANPLDAGADTFGGSTHKSFPGPQKGVLFTRSEQLRLRLVEAQFYLLSSHHFAETMALGLAAVEFEHFGRAYAAQVVTNANVLGRALLGHGFDVIGDPGGPTRTHQLWVHAGDAEATELLTDRLYRAGIRVNVQVDLPGCPGPMMRIGLNELTFEGAGEAAVTRLADAFAYARSGMVERVDAVRAEVRDMLTEPYYFRIDLTDGG